MAGRFGKKVVSQISSRGHSTGARQIVSTIFGLITISLLVALFAYLLWMSQNPGSNWNPFAGVGPGGVGNHSCNTITDCSGPWLMHSGAQICVSGRACICGQDVEYGGSSTCTCECGGSTAGACIDYTGTPAEGKECGLQGHPCGMGAGLVVQAPMCCPGDVCVNGKCEAPGGGWLAKCRIQEN